MSRRKNTIAGALLGFHSAAFVIRATNVVSPSDGIINERVGIDAVTINHVAVILPNTFRPLVNPKWHPIRIAMSLRQAMRRLCIAFHSHVFLTLSYLVFLSFRAGVNRPEVVKVVAELPCSIGSGFCSRCRGYTLKQAQFCNGFFLAPKDQPMPNQ